jgi:hypothetical protein
MPALSVNHMRQYIPLRDSIAAKLVGDNHSRRTAGAPQQLPEEALGRMRSRFGWTKMSMASPC